MAGGGAHGKDAGIVREITIPVGSPIKTFRLFIQEYPQPGETTIGSIGGKGIPGTTSVFRNRNSKIIGETGKETDIGKAKTTGVFKVYDPGHNPGKSIHPGRVIHSEKWNNRDPRYNSGKIEHRGIILNDLPED
ncbi:MAG: hypothetical protein AB2L12_03010 [Smithellaceae bacterium]